MSITTNKRKAFQLGMPMGTASHRLKKMVWLNLLQKLGEDVCFKCSEVIESAGDLTIEHKVPWLDMSPELFWDLENIAFSHRRCNRPDRSRGPKKFSHGRRRKYQEGCRCDMCKQAKSIDNAKRSG